MAKYCWDLSKTTVAALGIAPLAKPEAVDDRTVCLGIAVGITFAIFGYVLDGMEVSS